MHGARILRSLAPFVAASVVAPASGAQTVRHRFDPEDLDLEKPGVVHADMAFGIMRGPAAGRWLVPDFDVDIGLTSTVELGLDGAWAIEGTRTRLYALDHPAPDNLWLSSKIGLLDTRADDDGAAWAAGFQLGPRLATAPGVRGVGFQALGLVGRSFGRTHLVGNAGFLIDPGDAVARGRPAGALLGADLTSDLDARGIFSVAVDVSYMGFVSSDDDQLNSTVGLVWSAFPWLDLSANALVGVLDGGDHYGAYLGVSPRTLWSGAGGS